jgi:hypothetical protein
VNQNSALVDSDGWKYAGGADGGLNQGRYVFTGQMPQQSNFWVNFTAGLADNFTWGLSEGFTSANSGVNKDSLPYKLAAIAGLRGAGKQGVKQATKRAPPNRFNPTEVANDLGYSQRIPPQRAPFNSHGQPVFSNGKGYITPDVDGHNVTNGWKTFDRRGRRTGTWNSDLTRRIKD